MKILVLTSRFPFPLEKGDKLRIYNQMRELARLGHEIVLLALADEPVSDAYLNEIKQFCSRVYVYELTKKAIFSNILRNILRGPRLPFQVAYFFNASIKKQIEHVISVEKPDHIYCHLVRMSEYVSDVALPKTLDFMDAFGAGTAQRADISNFFLRPLWRYEAFLMLKYEQCIAAQFNHLTVISEQDRVRLPIWAKVVSVVGNGVDVDFFSLNSFNKKQLKTVENNLNAIKNHLEINNLIANKNDLNDVEWALNHLKFNENSTIEKDILVSHNSLINNELDTDTNSLENAKNNSELNEKLNSELNTTPLNLIKLNTHFDTDLIKKYDVCFVGNLGYYSNVEAVRYLIKKIFPLLKTLKPDIKILLAGARPTTEIQDFASENVTVLGWLDDIRTAYADSRILVAPLMHGIGQQNKILEAMAMHVPVVATSRVNNAIGAMPETEILVADTEGVFVEQILRLLQSVDFQGFIANNGQDFVEKNHSWKSATEGLAALVSE